MYGVRRAASELAVVPDKSCVTAAASSIPGVTDVASAVESSGQSLTLRGIEKPDQILRVQYRHDKLDGSFYFLTEYRNRVEFHHTYLLRGRPPPQSEVDQIRPTMLQIDHALELRRALGGTCATFGGSISNDGAR
jgi:hypothetical protein